MNTSSENIFPVFDKIISKEKKEKLLNQKGKVFWLTGLSGSGKTTIALQLEKELYKLGFLVQILDGDNIRAGINNNLSFSEGDRAENVRRISEISKLFLNCGVITINCFVSPTKKMRQNAKKIIGKENYYEIFINADIETCEKRDVKGLYKKVRSGEIKNFTGIDTEYEKPNNPSLEVDTSRLSLDKSIEIILKNILPQIKNN
ncbi:MAG: adenylyl-sulfate kinase [Flavobacteriales bacterium]|nr:adenylyl-sulfate kinase [Flavobacteriales bacterium]